MNALLIIGTLIIAVLVVIVVRSLINAFKGAGVDEAPEPPLDRVNRTVDAARLQ